MAFPQTRHTLIQRLAAGGDNSDWQDFLADYWGPVCGFALRRGDCKLADAEDAASQTFEVILRNELLKRWVNSKQAKLRTLMCSVVCRVQANQFRSNRRKELFQQKFADEVIREASQESSDALDEGFMAAWVDDLLQNTLQRLARDYHTDGKGDYFRVLHGRLCQGLSIEEVSQLLDISASAVNNYYRHVRKRLGQSLESNLRAQVLRYCRPEEAEAEFQAEWSGLAEYLSRHGGLEDAVGRAYQRLENQQLQDNKPRRIRDTLTKIRLAPSTP